MFADTIADLERILSAVRAQVSRLLSAYPEPQSRGLGYHMGRSRPGYRSATRTPRDF